MDVVCLRDCQEGYCQESEGCDYGDFVADFVCQFSRWDARQHICEPSDSKEKGDEGWEQDKGVFGVDGEEGDEEGVGERESEAKVGQDQHVA